MIAPGQGVGTGIVAVATGEGDGMGVEGVCAGLEAAVNVKPGRAPGGPGNAFVGSADEKAKETQKITRRKNNSR